MHFWIDKRSHTCGFGRARVAASLSGTGLGFGHLPRRMGGKRTNDRGAQAEQIRNDLRENCTKKCTNFFYNVFYQTP